MYMGACVCYRFCHAIVISSCFVLTRCFWSIMSHVKCEVMLLLLGYMAIGSIETVYLACLCKFAILNCCN